MSSVSYSTSPSSTSSLIWSITSLLTRDLAMTSSCCRLHCIDDALRKFFGWLGYQVGKRPGYFIIIPILLTALCASGFQRIYYEADPEYLFSPIDGEAKFERQALERHFPMDYKAFDPGRVSRAGRFGRLLIQASDNGSVLRDSVFKQVHNLSSFLFKALKKKFKTTENYSEE